MSEVQGKTILETILAAVAEHHVRTGTEPDVLMLTASAEALLLQELDFVLESVKKRMGVKPKHLAKFRGMHVMVMREGEDVVYGTCFVIGHVVHVALTPRRTRTTLADDDAQGTGEGDQAVPGAGGLVRDADAERRHRRPPRTPGSSLLPRGAVPPGGGEGGPGPPAR